MEAALAGCSVVCSIAGYEVEYYRELAYYCDPADVGSIHSAVLAAYQNYEKDAERRVRLKQRILSEYTWQRAAEATFQAYRQVLAGARPR
jgi:glycosyltransferase involved in cell wall biosynthesis